MKTTRNAACPTPGRFLQVGLVLLTMICATAVSAQSPFALTNVGQRIDAEDARMAARGYWGMAASDSLHPGFKNIASLTSLRHVALQFTGLGESVKSENSATTRTTYRTYAPDIRVGLPVLKGRIAVTGGFRIDRSMQYSTLRESTWFAWTDTLTGNQQFKREGTMFEVPLGLAVAPTEGLSLGVTIGLANGSVRETLSNFFVEPSGVTGAPFYATTSRVQEDELTGTAVTWSGLWSGWDRLQIGGSYTAAYDLDIDRKLSTVGVAQRGNQTLAMTMPAAWRAGIQVELSDRWRFGGDYQRQQFSDFVGLAEWPETGEDESTLGFGFERVRADVRRGGWGNLPVRVGATFRHWAYQVGGNPVEEKTFSVGTGFPFRRNLGQLDVALAYSRIGDQAKNGMESSVWRVTISVTGLERWW